jgi:hypothetical protein
MQQAVLWACHLFNVDPVSWGGLGPKYIARSSTRALVSGTPDADTIEFQTPDPGWLFELQTYSTLLEEPPNGAGFQAPTAFAENVFLRRQSLVLTLGDNSSGFGDPVGNGHIYTKWDVPMFTGTEAPWRAPCVRNAPAGQPDAVVCLELGLYTAVPFIGYTNKGRSL